MALATKTTETPEPPALVHRHRDWLARLIAARLSCPDLVDDVLQEVAVAVARAERPPVGEHEERPWLCVIAIRQAALLMRRLSRRSRLLAGAAEHRTQAFDDPLARDPIYWLISRERADLVTRACSRLDPEDRRLLEWKYVEGETYPQIARRLGVLRHVAEYRVVVAKKRLRTHLVAIGYEEDDA